tara:strand:+ start:554 stop:940 length:387 start_codon:yes stop_codon:yes gene_type:complete
MHIINIKRGLKQEIGLRVYELVSGNKVSVDFTSGYTASMKIVKRSGRTHDIAYEGDAVDTLTSAANRITFLYTNADTNPNVKLLWNTAQASALPNENVDVFGDLKIFDSSSECVYSIRFKFEIEQEIA